MGPSPWKLMRRAGATSRWPLVLIAAALGLLWFGPSAADAAILKRVHSGTTAITSTAAQTVTLELQDASKAFVVCWSRYTLTWSNGRATCVLSNNTLTIDVGLAAGTTGISVGWSVAEFESGVSVVRGTSTFNAGSATPATAPNIGTVDCTKSFVVMAGEQTDIINASSNDEEFMFLGVLGTFAAPCLVTAGATTSTLTLSRVAATSAATVSWQVVTMDGATVAARGTASMAKQIVATTATIPSTNTTTSFLMMSYQAGAGNGGSESMNLVRGDFSAGTCSGSPVLCTGLVFVRDLAQNTTGATIDVAYEVITLNDGSAVQRPASATTSSGTTSTMGAAGNITAVDRSAAMPIFTTSGGGSNTSNGLYDDLTWTPGFPSTTQLQFTRSASYSTVGIANWFVVSFYKCVSVNSRLCSMGVKGGDATATVSWSPLYDPQCVSGSTPTACQALVVRDTGTMSAFVPSGTYTVGQIISGNRVVVFNGTPADPTRPSFTDTVTTPPFTNGTKYFYRVYPRINGGSTYITDVSSTISEVTVTPGTSMAWSYSTTGGQTLAPIPGYGKVYVASNGNKMIALDSSTGLEVPPGPLATAPVIAFGAVQSYLGWFPVSGGTTEAVVVADANGWLTSVNAVTGFRNWSVQLPVDSGGGIYAAVSAQLYTYATCDSNAFRTQYGLNTDLIYVASRNISRSVNKVWGVKASTGAIQWTATPTNMDQATGQPYVDYCRNRLWVTTGRGSGVNQNSVWVIDTITGSSIPVASFNGGDLTSAAPTLSFNNNTVYTADLLSGTLTVRAFAAGTTPTGGPASQKGYTGTLASVSASSGFIWEDYSTLGRLYIPVTTTSPTAGAGVWCVEDNGSSFVSCSDLSIPISRRWSTNPSIPVTSGTSAEPLLTSTAIFFPSWVTPSGDGKIYQINTADGTLYGGTGHPFTVETGPVTLGGLSTEDWTQLYVGTSTGRSYRINLTGGNLP